MFGNCSGWRKYFHKLEVHYLNVSCTLFSVFHFFVSSFDNFVHFFDNFVPLFINLVSLFNKYVFLINFPLHYRASVFFLGSLVWIAFISNDCCCFLKKKYLKDIKNGFIISLFIKYSFHRRSYLSCFDTFYFFGLIYLPVSISFLVRK